MAYPDVALHIGLILVIFILTWITGVIPIKFYKFIVKRSHFHQTICLINSFSAGVFIAAAMVDQLPEIKMRERCVMSLLEFPVVEFCVCLSIFLLMVVEQGAVLFKGHHHHCGQMIASPECSMTQATVGHSRATGSPPRSNSGHPSDGVLRNGGIYSNKSSLMKRLSNKSDEERNMVNVLTADAGTSVPGLSSPVVTVREPHSSDGKLRTGTASSSSQTEMKLRESHSGDDKLRRDSASSSRSSEMKWQSMIILFCLSLHSILAGLQLGVATKWEEITGLFIAIILHRLPIVFTVGIQLVQTYVNTINICLYMAIFSSTVPLGALIGLFLNTIVLNEQSNMVIIALESFATGGFLYVSFLEIIPGELDKSHIKPGILKVMLIYIGFLSLSTILYFLNRFHQHSRTCEII